MVTFKSHIKEDSSDPPFKEAFVALREYFDTLELTQTKLKSYGDCYYYKAEKSNLSHLNGDLIEIRFRCIDNSVVIDGIFLESEFEELSKIYRTQEEIIAHATNYYIKET